jgi:uncharacterized protein YutE (UPF0331/DUF86 family)
MIHTHPIRSEKIRFLLSEIDLSLSIIQDNLPVTDDYDEFINLGLLKDGLYKRLEYILQSIFDICAILNRDLKLGVPMNDDDIIGNLVKSGYLDPEMGELLKDMKGLKNILVHQYGKINDVLVFDVLKTQLNDISAISEHLNRIISTNHS